MKSFAPVLVSSFLLSVGIAMTGCATNKKGMGSGASDSGVSQGGSDSGGATIGGSNATGGTVGTGGAVGQGRSSVPGQGGSGGAAGSGSSIHTGGGSGGSAGREGSGGATASGGVAGGSGGSTAAGGVASTGGTQSGGSTGSGTAGVGSGGSTGSGTGGTRTGGSTGPGSGGARTGGSTGSGGSGTGGRGTGGVTTGGANGGAGGISAGGAGGVGGTPGSGGGGSGLGGSIGHASCQADTDCTGTNSGYKCCDHLCSNTQNDILNCGGCGTKCSEPNPYCGGGKCAAPPCQGTVCADGSTCCGSQCCGAGKLCCTVNLGPSMIGCYDPVDGTCPTGCATCVCASPDTPIATPQGERPIAELRVGDWVYSVDRGEIRPVPIKRINRQSVFPSHTMVNLRLASGRSLLVSPLHPTADGRTFRELARGDLLDGVAIVEARTVPYDQPFTYDILPDSDSGAYFAASVLIGSTLATSTAQPLVSTGLPMPASFFSVR
jgi:hypothetical protein